MSDREPFGRRHPNWEKPSIANRVRRGATIPFRPNLSLSNLRSVRILYCLLVPVRRVVLSHTVVAHSISPFTRSSLPFASKRDIRGYVKQSWFFPFSFFVELSRVSYLTHSDTFLPP